MNSLLRFLHMQRIIAVKLYCESNFVWIFWIKSVHKIYFLQLFHSIYLPKAMSRGEDLAFGTIACNSLLITASASTFAWSENLFTKINNFYFQKGGWPIWCQIMHKSTIIPIFDILIDLMKIIYPNGSQLVLMMME